MIFLKGDYLKASNIQRQMVIEEDNLVHSKEGEKFPEDFKFELFEKGLNPLVDTVITRFRRYKVLEIDCDGEVRVDSSLALHYVVRVSAGVEATLILESASQMFAGVEIFLAERAKLKVVLIQVHCEEFCFSAIRAKLAFEAEITYYLNYANLVRGYSFVQSVLEGDRSKSDIYMLVEVEDQAVNDMWVGNCFLGRNCRGEILSKVVAKEECLIGVLGEIEIGEQGQGTDSYLKQDILMLDDISQVEAVPSLEVRTNDVKAGHGVSVSKLTEEKLFYLTSRGIPTEEAQKLVTKGFLREVYEKIGIEEFVEKLELIYE